jgi:hypothetical protein
MGGLGNQLFQIFAVMAYAMRFNEPFTFTNAKYLGGQYNNRVSYWDSFLSNLKTSTSDLNRFTTDIRLDEQGFHYSELPQTIDDKNVFLYGYFQSYKYFADKYTYICDLINLKQKKTEVLERHPTFAKIFSNENNRIVSLHFRLGDYKYLSSYHPILPLEYYRKSIEKIIFVRQHVNLEILYFCEKEDNEIIEKNIEKLKEIFPDCNFVKADDNIGDWEQMLIMSMCNDNIIANSSFSWWGAYFNNNMNKIVCYPDIWFGPALENYMNDMYPPDWCKISCYN